jgi:hypothetical protein
VLNSGGDGGTTYQNPITNRAVTQRVDVCKERIIFVYLTRSTYTYPQLNKEYVAWTSHFSILSLSNGGLLIPAITLVGKQSHRVKHATSRVQQRGIARSEDKFRVECSTVHFPNQTTKTFNLQFLTPP